MPEEGAQARVARATVVALTILGAALRLAFLGQPMRLDETAAYALIASQPIARMLTNYLPNNHLLHTVLVHFVTSAFGDSPLCIRSVAVTAGVALVPATYAVVAEIFDRPTALLATALAAASSPLVEFSCDARGYTLQAFFTLVVFYAAAKILRAGGRRWWGLFAASAWLGFATIPTMLLFFPGPLLWLVVAAARGDARVGPRPMAARAAVAGAGVSAATVLTYLPFLLGSGFAAFTENRWVKPMTLKDYTAGAGANLANDVVSWHRGLPWPVSLVLGSLAVLSLVIFSRVSRFKVNPVPITLGCAVAVMSVQRVLPPERVWLPAVPLYLASVACGFRWLASRSAALQEWWKEKRIGPIVPAALTVLAGGGLAMCVLASRSPYQTPDQVTFRDAEPLTELLAGILQPGDIVYLHSDAAYVLEYYFEQHHVPRHYVYRRGRESGSIARAFVVDAHVDYPNYTFQEALNASNLARSKSYAAVVVAKLPNSTLYRVTNPEIAPSL